MKNPFVIKIVYVSVALVGLLFLPYALVASSDQDEINKQIQEIQDTLSANWNALPELRELVEMGDIEACSELCSLLPSMIPLAGAGPVTVYDEEVFKCCKKAAEQGDAIGQASLGTMYFGYQVTFPR